MRVWSTQFPEVLLDLGILLILAACQPLPGLPFMALGSNCLLVRPHAKTASAREWRQPALPLLYSFWILLSLSFTFHLLLGSVDDAQGSAVPIWLFSVAALSSFLRFDAHIMEESQLCLPLTSLSFGLPLPPACEPYVAWINVAWSSICFKPDSALPLAQHSFAPLGFLLLLWLVSFFD